MNQRAIALVAVVFLYPAGSVAKVQEETPLNFDKWSEDDVFEVEAEFIAFGVLCGDVAPVARCPGKFQAEDIPLVVPRPGPAAIVVTYSFFGLPEHPGDELEEPAVLLLLNLIGSHPLRVDFDCPEEGKQEQDLDVKVEWTPRLGHSLSGVLNLRRENEEGGIAELTISGETVAELVDPSSGNVVCTSSVQLDVKARRDWRDDTSK